MFLLANLLRAGRNSKTIGETNINSAIEDKIKSYLPVGENSQEIEQNNNNIEKLIQIVDSILSGDGGIKEFEAENLFDSISSFNLYENTLGEMEARAVQQTQFDFYNFHTNLEKVIDNAFRENIPFNRKMTKYLSDRANIKRIELAEEIRQTVGDFISPLPNSDIELMKVVDAFLASDEAFNLKQNPEFQSFRSNVQRLTEELSDSYIDAVNFLRSEGVSILTMSDINFGDDLTNAYVTKLLDSRGKEKQIFKGSKKAPSFITQGTFDPSAKIGQKPISNEAIEAQIKLEEEL
jgi:hypothetical protein